MQLINRQQVQDWLPAWSSDAHKQDFGHLWVFAGSVGFSGAPRLVAMGAQAMRAGLVSLVVPDEIYPIVATASLEEMVHPQSATPDYQARADAVVAGPGWGMAQQCQLSVLLQSELPLVLDADALNMMAEDRALQDAVRQRRAATVLTPHPGEAARLLGWNSASQVQQDRGLAWRKMIEAFGCVVVLKGAGTLAGDAQENVYRCPFGNKRLATAGSGDVLAGMVGTLLAQRVAPGSASACAVALHALTTECDGWYRAGQLGDMVAKILASFRNGNSGNC